MTLSFVLPEPFQVRNLLSTITLLRLCPPLSPTLRHIHRILQVHGTLGKGANLPALGHNPFSSPTLHGPRYLELHSAKSLIRLLMLLPLVPWLNPTCPDSVKGSVLYNLMCVLETQRVNKSQTSKSQGPCLSFCICSTVMRNENYLYSAYC